MDFSQVTGVRRYSPLDKTQSDLRYITHVPKGGAQTCLWKRPLSYPALGIVMSYPDIFPSGVRATEHQVSWAAVDKYGIACRWSRVNGNTVTQEKNADGSYTFYREASNLYVSIGDSANMHTTDILWPNPYGKTTLTTRWIGNESRLMEYPTTLPPLFGSQSAGVVWYFSDVTTKKIKLYARPILTNANNSLGQWDPTTLILRTTYKDYEPQLKEHETDVVVDAGEPLITLATMKTAYEVNAKGAIRTIEEIRTNLDDYKAKYDAATGGKYSKSQYPYLLATIVLGVRISGAEIQTSNNVIHWDMMYLTFEVER